MAEIILIEIAKDLNMSISTDLVNPKIMDFYKKSKAFTDYFFDKTYEVLLKHDMYPYNGMTYKKNVKYFQREKLSIDLVVWESAYDKFDRFKIADKDTNIEFAGYIWKYVLLIEHENDGEDWLHELQKLCMTSSPYKLLVTYGRRVQNNPPVTKGNKGVRVLEQANEIVNFVGNYGFKEFVIMFGEETNNLDNVIARNELVYDIYKYDIDLREFVKHQ
jgi:hypothetical protein